MIDVRTLTREGRLALAVIEWKADEDIICRYRGSIIGRESHGTMRGEFQKFGYFPGRELSSRPPLLTMAAPALHLQPATDTRLRYISPQIEWTLLGIDEDGEKNLN